MPSMSTSHGGVLYYVVKIPKRRDTYSPDRTSSSLFLDENAITSTPISAYQYDRCNEVIDDDEDDNNNNNNNDDTDSGWDNPFRPDGDLSKEADEIVELIKEGKPITPTGGNSKLLLEENGAMKTSMSQTYGGANSKANGNVDKVVTGVEVQHGTIATPTEASQVEHVVIKKKPKCKCCVIQ